MKEYVKKIFIFALCIFAVSCSNLMSPSQEDTAPADDGTIRFEINKNDNLSRNAAPQAFLNGIYYRLTISKASDPEVNVVSKFQTTLSFSIQNPSWTGASIAKLEMYCPRTEGSSTDVSTDSDGVVTITSAPCMTGEKSFTLEANTRVFNFEIGLDFSGTDNGTIKLPVTVGSTNIKSCIIVPDFAGSNASKYIKAEVTDAGEIFVLSTAPFSDHAVFYFFEEDDDVLTVSTAQLKKAKLIYSDSITVFPKTTTDKWIGINGEEKTVDLQTLLYSTFYVASTGDDGQGGSKLKPVKTLSTAISKCAQTADGGTIYIQSQPADTDTIVIDKKVKIENISGGTTKFTLPNIEIKDFSSATQVSIKGVKISKSGATGISVGKNCSLTLDNVEVSGCKDGITADEACTVDLTNSSAVKSCTGYGIQLKNSSGVLKIDGTEVNADKAASADFNDCDLYYNKGKVVRLNTSSGKTEADLKAAFSALKDFGDGSQLLFGKTTSSSLSWSIKEGIEVEGISTYTVKTINDSSNVTIIRDTSATKQFALLKSTGSGTWNLSNLTFEGGSNITLEDTSLNSDGLGGAVYMAGGTFNLTKCTFSKNNAENGGAVYVNAGTLELTSCTFGGNSTTRNSAKVCGGAIYLKETSYASLTVNSGTISYNTAKKGGAIYAPASTTAELKGGLISSNTATTAGGAVYYEGNHLKVSGCTYIAPGAAALKNDVYLASSNKYIEVTAALTPKLNGSSGTAATYTAAITPSTWKRGAQVLSGDYAAIDFAKFKGSETDWLTIKDTNDSNKVKLYTSYKIYVAGSGHNTALGDGKTSANGGLGTKAKPYASIGEAVNQCWDSNYADGFTIYLSGELKDAAQEIPAKNTTAKTGLAKSITLTGYTGNSSDVINRNLTAVPSSGSGTALTINNTAPVTIKKIKITGGYTNGNGGGINIASGTTVKLADDVLVSGNTAKLGGGVYNAGTLFMYKNAIVGYSASSIITTYASGYTYEQAVISKGGNVATGSSCRAGGIYNNSGSIYLGYTELSGTTPVAAAGENAFTGGVMGNYASDQGGGIFMSGGNLYMNKGNISWNKTESGGGGVRVSDSAKMYMYDGNIEGNAAVSNGGGIYVGVNETLEMSGGTIKANTAGTKGGAICISSGTVTLSGSAYIPYGANSSTGVGKNDVSIDGEKFNISALTPPSTCTNGVVATIHPVSYDVSTKIIKTSSGYAYAPSLAVIPQTSPSQSWVVNSTDGKLKKVTKITADNINSMVSTLTSDTVTEFFADSTFDNDALKSLKQKLEALDSDNTAEIKLDLSQSSVTEIWESGIISNRVTSLTIPNTLTGAIWQGLWDAKELTEIRVSKANTKYCSEDGILYSHNSSGEKTGLVFYPAAKSGTSYTLPSTVTYLDAACFRYNKNLTTINGLTQITQFSSFGHQFNSCMALTGTIDLSNATLSTEMYLTTIGFCPYITAVKLPSSIRLIEGNNFSYCNALVEVHFGSSTPPSVNGTIFTSPNESLRIYVPSSAKSAYLNATGANGFAGAKNALSDSLESKIIEE